MHTVAHVLGVMFSWPDGIVTGNLIASAMCWTAGLVHLERRHRQLRAHLTAMHRAGPQ